MDACPEGYGTRDLRVLYRVIPSESPPGILTITITTSPEYALSQPWKLGIGFDFDIGRDRIGPGKKYDTYIMFIQEEPPREAKIGQGEVTPEAVLFRDRKLDVNAFLDLGEETDRSYKYGDVLAWRLVALGYPKKPCDWG